MNIPLLDLKRQYHSIKLEIDEAIQKVLESGRFILGPEVKAFEEEIATYCGVKHAIGVASGTDALLLSLRALGIGPGDKVIIPSFTFFATAGVVHNVGATPVFADIDPKTYNIDPENVRELFSHYPSLITEAKAIIPVHLYGQPADMDEIMEIAKEYNLYVIEDAAQAIGAEYRGRKVGTIGNLGCFSFFPTKNLGAYGDGGMVITNDDKLAEQVRILRVHGSKPKYYHHTVGTNSRLDAIQAAILCVKLPHLEEWTAARQRIATTYDDMLKDVHEIEIPYRAPDRTHIFHQYTIRVADGKRDALQKYLKGQDIGTGIYYPLPLHLQECFQPLGYKKGDLPVSEQASHKVLSLSIFPELTEEEIRQVVKAIREFFVEK